MNNDSPSTHLPHAAEAAHPLPEGSRQHDLTPKGLQNRLKMALDQSESGTQHAAPEQTVATVNPVGRGLSIRVKLLGTFALLVFLTVLTSAIALWRIGDLTTLSESLSVLQGRQAKGSEELRYLLQGVIHHEKELAGAGDSLVIERLNRSLVRLQERVTQLRASAGASSGQGVRAWEPLLLALEKETERFAALVGSVQGVTHQLREEEERFQRQREHLKQQLWTEGEAIQNGIADLQRTMILEPGNREAMEERNRHSQLLLALQTAMAESQSGLFRYLENRNNANAEWVLAGLGDIRNRLEALLQSDKGELDRLSNLRKRLGNYRGVIRDLVQSLEQWEQNQARLRHQLQQQQLELRQLGENMLERVAQMAHDSWSALDSENQRMIKSGSAALWFLGGLALLTLLVGVGVVYRVTQSILNAMQQLLHHASRLADGDLSEPITLATRDELGQVADAFESMRLALLPMIRRILSASVQISSMVHEIQASSSQYASNAAQQAAAINEFSTTLTQISQSAITLLETGRNLSEVSFLMGEMIASGNDKSNLTLDSMGVINQSTQQISNRIGALNGKMDAIAEAMTAIAGVADQTVLLSLNAAIEANRAGDAGRGFTVVAGEIRRLSERSISSSAEIGSLIQDMQRSTENAVVTIDKFGEEIRTSIRQIREVLDLLTNSHQTMLKVGTQTGVIMSSLESQTEASKQAKLTVEELNSTANLAAQASRQNAMVAYELNAMAEQMRKSVSVFKLENV
ncbi:MAG: HAMP domain-containing protein [Magnetococcales bacterium]|nr:HAMP domain-containing protein [Magnetococcales bacterium]MBF0114224.1 HAMP domain-containing protein [Magnetococcales bacterium]